MTISKMQIGDLYHSTRYGCGAVIFKTDRAVTIRFENGHVIRVIYNFK